MDPAASGTPVTHIGPDDRPFTLDEVRDHVDDLIREYAGEPGIELVGLVSAMLAQTRCVCAPAEGRDATVIDLPASRPNRT